jgi:hypothetical protein
MSTLSVSSVSVIKPNRPLSGGYWREFANVRRKWQVLMEENPPKDILTLSPKVQSTANIVTRDPTPEDQDVFDVAGYSALADYVGEGPTVMVMNPEDQASEAEKLYATSHDLVHALQNGQKHLDNFHCGVANPDLEDLEDVATISCDFLSEVRPLLFYISSQGDILKSLKEASPSEQKVLAKDLVKSALEMLDEPFRETLMTCSDNALHMSKHRCLNEIQAHSLPRKRWREDPEYQELVISDLQMVVYYQQLYQMCRDEERRRMKNA